MSLRVCCHAVCITMEGECVSASPTLVVLFTDSNRVNKQAMSILVSVPGPNQPQRGSLSVLSVILEAIYVLDDRSGNETMSIHTKTLQYPHTTYLALYTGGGVSRQMQHSTLSHAVYYAS